MSDPEISRDLEDLLEQICESMRSEELDKLRTTIEVDGVEYKIRITT